MAGVLRNGEGCCSRRPIFLRTQVDTSQVETSVALTCLFPLPPQHWPTECMAAWHLHLIKSKTWGNLQEQPRENWGYGNKWSLQKNVILRGLKSTSNYSKAIKEPNTHWSSHSQPCLSKTSASGKDIKTRNKKVCKIQLWWTVGEAQQQSTCLANVKPWVQTPVLQKISYGI
jgi:hypothetical protein